MSDGGLNSHRQHADVQNLGHFQHGCSISETSLSHVKAASLRDLKNLCSSSKSTTDAALSGYFCRFFGGSERFHAYSGCSPDAREGILYRHGCLQLGQKHATYAKKRTSIANA